MRRDVFTTSSGPSAETTGVFVSLFVGLYFCFRFCHLTIWQASWQWRTESHFAEWP